MPLFVHIQLDFPVVLTLGRKVSSVPLSALLIRNPVPPLDIELNIFSSAEPSDFSSSLKSASSVCPSASASWNCLLAE